MRTWAGVAVAASSLLLALGACSDGGGSLGTEVDQANLEEALADDPTLGECREAALTFMERIEVPDGFDPSDGVDDDERRAAEAAVDAASEGLFDPNDDAHPCNVLLAGLTDVESEALISQLDPEVIALLGSMARTEVEQVEIDE